MVIGISGNAFVGDALTTAISLIPYFNEGNGWQSARQHDRLFSVDRWSDHPVIIRSQIASDPLHSENIIQSSSHSISTFDHPSCTPTNSVAQKQGTSQGQALRPVPATEISGSNATPALIRRIHLISHHAPHQCSDSAENGSSRSNHPHWRD